MRLISAIQTWFRKRAETRGPADAEERESRKIRAERLPIREWEPLGYSILDAALRFWFDNQQDDAPPDWSCFRPERHPTMLPHIILYEKIGDRFFTRIVGDAMSEYLPENPMGKFLDEVVTRDRLDDVIMRLDRTLSDGLPNYVEKTNLWRDGGELFGYNALSMPFLHSDDNPRVLCVFSVNTERSRFTIDEPAPDGDS